MKTMKTKKAAPKKTKPKSKKKPQPKSQSKPTKVAKPKVVTKAVVKVATPVHDRVNRKPKPKSAAVVAGHPLLRTGQTVMFGRRPGVEVKVGKSKCLGANPQGTLHDLTTKTLYWHPGKQTWECRPCKTQYMRTWGRKRRAAAKAAKAAASTSAPSAAVPEAGVQ